MKNLLFSVCLGVLALGTVVGEAEAKRLGGGNSIGMQRQAAPAHSANVAKPAAPPAAAPAAAPVAPPKRSWLGPLAGLAAGIGIAALLSHFGMGEAVGNFLMIALLAFAVIFVVRWFLRRNQPPVAEQPMQYAGVGGPGMAPPPDYSAASAAPAVTSASELAPVSAPRIPADFDSEGFLRIAKVNFIRLQASNDAGNLDDIREFTSSEMFAEIKLDIDARKGQSQRTDVVTLDAELLEVVSEGHLHIASVRFHGMLREDSNTAAAPFDEVWTLSKAINGNTGWVLSGITQLG